MGVAIGLVIFDLDGTLVDSLPDIAGALNQTLAEAGLPPVPSQRVRGYVGDGAARLVQRALSAAPAAEPDEALVADLTGRFRRHYAARLYAETRPYAGIDAVLGQLSAAMPIAVVTNKPNELARPLLAGVGLDRYITDVVADGDGFARALAVPAVSVTWGYVERERLAAEQPAWLIDQPADLLPIALRREP